MVCKPNSWSFWSLWHSAIQKGKL